MPNRWIPFPKARRFGNAARLAGARDAIPQIHPGHEFLQGVLRRFAFNLHPVQFGHFVPGAGNPGLQAAIIGQYDQTFRVSVQPTGGIDVGDWNVVGQRRPPISISKLGQHAVGLVEQNEATQTEQPLPKALQKRRDSG